MIAATGTGKTVVATFDFERFFTSRQRQARLLYVAHRQEILTQALGTFRNVLRMPGFGELLVGGYQPSRADHLFCSVGMLASRKLWEQVGADFYDYIVVDEAHHGTAPSYRPLFDHFTPRILLGLTATPERMDGKPVAADFDNRFAAEIRLPEALEESSSVPSTTSVSPIPSPWMPTSSGPAASTSAVNWSGSTPAPTPWRSSGWTPSMPRSRSSNPT